MCVCVYVCVCINTYVYIYIANEPSLVGVLVKKAVSRSQLYMPQVRFSELRL